MAQPPVLTLWSLLEPDLQASRHKTLVASGHLGWSCGLAADAGPWTRTPGGIWLAGGDDRASAVGWTSGR